MVLSDLKTSIVIPVYKGKGSKGSAGSHCPIFLLHGVAKVFEGMLSKQMTTFVEANTLLRKHQFGFRRQRSTTDQLVQMTSSIRRAFDSKALCDGLYLDQEYILCNSTIPQPMAEYFCDISLWRRFGSLMPSCVATDQSVQMVCTLQPR